MYFKTIFGLVVLTVLISAPTAFADECITGQTRFNWKKMQEETCPPNGDWDICKTVKFPENEKTNGNTVCKTLGAGQCRSVNREQALGLGAREFLKYECSEDLTFLPTQNQPICKTTALGQTCIGQKTEVVCCN
jgi:hypothetical protein